MLLQCYDLNRAIYNWFTDTVSAVGKFPEPVQTFDYGHGAASRRMDIPNTGMSALLKKRGVFFITIPFAIEQITSFLHSNR
jgi:hypothetical protein